MFQHWGQMMMLVGGSQMIIFLLGYLSRTGLELAERHWSRADPRLQVCTFFFFFAGARA